MPIKRTPFQVQKVAGIDKKRSLCAPLRWPPVSVKRMDMGTLNAAVQRRAESGHVGLAPFQEYNARKNYFACQQGRQRLPLAMEQIQYWEGPEHSWRVGLMLAALGDYKWVLPGIDMDSTGLYLPGGKWKRSECQKNLNRRYCMDLEGQPSFLQTKQYTEQPLTSNKGQRYRP